MTGLPSEAVRDALIRHYRPPNTDRAGEILLTEVLAPGSDRRCDLLRVGMWKSRGTGVDVHEIKVTRSDWMRELGNPAKAEAWWKFCSRFWVVAVPGIIDPHELPEGWGLMVLPSQGRRFKIKVQASSKTPELTVPLLIELLRRCDNARLAEMDTLREAHREALYQQKRKIQAERVTAGLPRDVQDRLEFLTRLEQAIGLQADLYAWEFSRQLDQMNPEELAAALAGARDQVAAHRSLSRSERRAKQIREAAEAVLAELARDPAELATGTGP